MMSSTKKNKAALNSIKMQAANEVGVPLKDNGYNGDLTAKQAGSVGGQMVKKMIPIVSTTFTYPYLRNKPDIKHKINVFLTV